MPSTAVAAADVELDEQTSHSADFLTSRVEAERTRGSTVGAGTNDGTNDGTSALSPHPSPHAVLGFRDGSHDNERGNDSNDDGQGLVYSFGEGEGAASRSAPRVNIDMRSGTALIGAGAMLIALCVVLGARARRARTTQLTRALPSWRVSYARVDGANGADECAEMQEASPNGSDVDRGGRSARGASESVIPNDMD